MPALILMSFHLLRWILSCTLVCLFHLIMFDFGKGLTLKRSFPLLLFAQISLIHLGYYTFTYSLVQEKNQLINPINFIKL